MAKFEKVSGSAAQQESYRGLVAGKGKAEARLHELAAITRPAEAAEGDIAAAKHDRPWTASRECADATAPQSRDFCAAFEELKADMETALHTADIRAERAQLQQIVASANGRLEA
jgi:hypothetical protein